MRRSKKLGGALESRKIIHNDNYCSSTEMTDLESQWILSNNYARLFMSTVCLYHCPCMLTSFVIDQIFIIPLYIHKNYF